MDTCPMDVQLMRYDSLPPPSETQVDEQVVPDPSASPEKLADAPKAEASADHPAFRRNLLVIDVWPSLSRA